MDPWTSTNGIRIADRVPADLRRDWVARGWCPGRDLYSLFRDTVRADPRRTAIVDTAGSVDYAELDDLARRVAAALRERSYGPHDVIGMQAANNRWAVVAELAVAAIGAVALPYPPGRGWRDTVSLLGRSRASATIAGDPASAATVAAAGRRLPDLDTVFVFGDAPDGCEPLAPWLDRAGDAPAAADPDVSPEAPARILVSSGSEAEPKMVAYSHNAMAGGRGNYVGALHDGSEPMRNLVLVPLYSSFGSLGTSVTLARHGGTLVLQESFDSAAAVGAITTHRPTHVFGVPTMLARMARQPPAVDEDTSSLRAVVASGAALPAGTARACEQRFARPVLNVYGSADGVNCHTTAADSPPSPGLVGRPDPTVADIRIVGEGGDEMAAGGEGEIWARGPMTPLCYVNAAELDERYRPPGGWVRTGDRGLMDGDGRLQVVDRAKQIVVRGGYNISPAEVEQHLHAHPHVAEAACLPLPDPELGERLCACVTQPAGAAPLTLAQLNEFLEDSRGLERRKLPEALIVLPELPLGPTGKVCRRTLGELAAVKGGQRGRADAVPEPSRSDRTRP